MTTNKTALAVVSEQSHALAPLPANIVKTLMNGDLSKLTEEEQVVYYLHRCASLGLDPSSQPFLFLKTKATDKEESKTLLYATRSCTDQLGRQYNLKGSIVDVKAIGEVVIVTVRVADSTGRSVDNIGAASLGKWADHYANAYKRAVTQGYRRAIIQFCGLGVVDEEELADMPPHTTFAPQTKVTEVPPRQLAAAVNKETGEITTPTKPADVTREELQALAATLRELAPDEDVTLPDKMTRGEARHFKQLWENAIAVARVASQSDQDAADDSFGMPEGSV